jgi:hypothetical protein
MRSVAATSLKGKRHGGSGWRCPRIDGNCMCLCLRLKEAIAECFPTDSGVWGGGGGHLVFLRGAGGLAEQREWGIAMELSWSKGCVVG